MTLKKFVLIPVIIGVLACLIQALDQLLYTSVPPEGNVGFSWISFQSWAVYFLAGCTVRDKSLYCLCDRYCCLHCYYGSRRCDDACSGILCRACGGRSDCFLCYFL